MNSTGFANVKRRVIYRNPKTGAFFVKTAEGLKKYSPTARFRMTNNGKALRITMNTRNNVPNKIRPARVRISAADAKKRAQQRRANKAEVRRGASILDRMMRGLRPSTRKVRSNYGKARNLILSPGGSTLFKGKSAATMAMKKRAMGAKPRNASQNLINAGFNPRIVRQVLAKMKASGKPKTAYSKTTGKVKKN
jgi:hypothetical protein